MAIRLGNLAQGTEKSDQLASLGVELQDKKQDGGSRLCILQKQQIVMQQLKFVKRMSHKLSLVVSHSMAPTSTNIEMFCEGSYQEVISMCKPESRLRQCAELVQLLELSGYKVQASASKKFSTQFDGLAWLEYNMHHHHVACAQFEFEGLILEREHTDWSSPVVRRQLEILQIAKVQSVLMTQENLCRACYVAWQCGLAPVAETKFYISQGDQNNLQWREIAPVSEGYEYGVLGPVVSTEFVQAEIKAGDDIKLAVHPEVSESKLCF